MAENLQQKCVVEYPTILVLFPAECASYAIATKEQEQQYAPQWNESKNNKRRYNNNNFQRRNKFSKPAEGAEEEFEEEEQAEEPKQEEAQEPAAASEPGFLPPVPPQLFESIMKDIEYNTQNNVPLYIAVLLL